jgi:phosphatidylinositol-3-phosphatase
MKLWVVVCLLSGLALAQVPQSSHIWVVTEENHSYEEVIGNTSMPYFNSLAQTYGLATQYYSTQHNSLAALMWLVAGQEVTTNDNSTQCFNVDNVVRDLLAGNLTWRAYEEDLPYAGFQGLSYANYVRRHNPLIDFVDACTQQQQVNSVPFTQLASDIQNNTTPNYAYITPNLLHDAHNGTLAQADEWLSQNMPAILALPEFQPGGDGLMFVVWDEGDLDLNGEPDVRCSEQIDTGCGGRIATLVIGPQVRPAYQSQTLYSHPSLLATVCAAMAFASCPGAGSLASGMTDFFNTVSIATPLPNEVVASPMRVVATTNNDSTVYAMQIYVDNQLQYQTKGDEIDTNLAMTQGQHFVVVQSWDVAGGIHKRGLSVTVQPNAVIVRSPLPDAVVASPVSIWAQATGQDPATEMQVYVDGNLQYQVNRSDMETTLPMSAGVHNIMIESLGKTGEIAQTSLSVTEAAPAVTITSPLTGSYYSPIPLLASTIDPATVKTVQALLDNTLVYQYTGTGIIANLSMGVGQHTLAVKATDSKNGAFSSSVNLTIIPIPVTITAPQPNSNVSSPVLIQASVPQNSPVYAMQVYVDNQLQYQVNGTSVNTSLPMSAGKHYIVVQAWDTGGGVWKAGVYVTVQGTNGGVTVTSPVNNSKVSSPVNFAGSAQSPNCSGGIADIRIYPSPGWDDYDTHSSQFNTNLQLTSGEYNAVVQAWDNCDNVFKTQVAFTVE